MTVLPSAVLAPTTTTVGVFRAATREITEWLLEGLNEGSRKYQATAVTGSAGELIAQLRPLTIPEIERYLLVGVDGTTFLLNNSSLGTDLGMLPSLCARQLGVTGIRATQVDADGKQYPATILEVFTADGERPLRHRRTISAANDGGHWVFNQSGEPFVFENLEAYSSRSIRERFTGSMLYQYLEHLEVPTLTNLNYRPREAMLLRA